MRNAIIGLILLSLFVSSCTTTKQITNFDECVAAGNPVMTSYPAQCVADGQTFTEDITPVEDLSSGNNDDEIKPPSVSQSELSAHNSESDCWIAYENNVYDLTNYLPKHPDGGESIAEYCGSSDDFEVAFVAKHGKSKVEMLLKEGVFKGELA